MYRWCGGKGQWLFLYVVDEEEKKEQERINSRIHKLKFEKV